MALEKSLRENRRPLTQNGVGKEIGLSFNTIECCIDVSHTLLLPYEENFKRDIDNYNIYMQKSCQRFVKRTLIYRSIKLIKRTWNQITNSSIKGGYDTLKYGDVHEKFIFLETQDFRPLRTCQKQFEAILPNFPLDECES